MPEHDEWEEIYGGECQPLNRKGRREAINFSSRGRRIVHHEGRVTR